MVLGSQGKGRLGSGRRKRGEEGRAREDLLSAHLGVCGGKRARGKVS